MSIRNPPPTLGDNSVDGSSAIRRNAAGASADKPVDYLAATRGRTGGELGADGDSLGVDGELSTDPPELSAAGLPSCPHRDAPPDQRLWRASPVSTPLTATTVFLFPKD